MDNSLQPSRRPLTNSELRLLRAKARSLKARGRRGATNLVITGIGIFLALWLVTVFVSDAPLLVITLFWGAVACVIMLWIVGDARKDARRFEAMEHGLDAAIERNLAEVYDIRARSFVEFEELEDEGACYAFELEGGRIAFIVGQEFYRGARFPSLDFSIVYPLDETGQPVDMWIEKRGAGVQPSRVITAAQKDRLREVEHLEVLSGGMADLEGLLRRR